MHIAPCATAYHALQFESSQFSSEARYALRESSGGTPAKQPHIIPYPATECKRFLADGWYCGTDGTSETGGTGEYVPPVSQVPQVPPSAKDNPSRLPCIRGCLGTPSGLRASRTALRPLRARFARVPSEASFFGASRLPRFARLVCSVVPNTKHFRVFRVFRGSIQNTTNYQLILSILSKSTGRARRRHWQMIARQTARNCRPYASQSPALPQVINFIYDFAQTHA